MSYINSINTLPQQYIKDMKIKKNSKDEGITFKRMESGRPNYNLRWEDVLYDLTLQVLTKEEVVKIKKEVTDSIITYGLITLDYNKMLKAGWFDFEETGGTDPKFYVTPPGTLTRVPGTDFWNLTLNLSQRIKVI